MQEQGEQARNILTQFWDKIYNTREEPGTIMRGNVQHNILHPMGEFFLIQNHSRSNAFPAQPSSKNLQILNEFDEAEFNFCQMPKGSKLIHCQFDEFLLLDSNEVERKQEEDGEVHPILINTAPIFPNHCLLVPFIWDKLPQILGPDLLAAVWNIFKIAPGVRLGFNSIGGGASINHLHFHLFYAKDVTNCDRLPIETFPKTLLASSKPPKTPASVSLMEIDYKGIQALVMQVIEPNPNSTAALMQVFQLLTELLIELNIPHNFLCTDNGSSIYLMMRDFDFKIGVVQMMGVEVLVGDEKIVGQADIIASRQQLTKNQAIKDKILEFKTKVKNDQMFK